MPFLDLINAKMLYINVYMTLVYLNIVCGPWNTPTPIVPWQFNYLLGMP
jgi:hypothetical protein